MRIYLSSRTTGLLLLLTGLTVLGNQAAAPPDLSPPRPGPGFPPLAVAPTAVAIPDGCAIWTQKTPALSPSARRGFSLAYDGARQQTLLFGGYDNSFLFDTWTWDGGNWTRQNPATSPANSWHSGMAYDAARGEVVLFGGYDGTSAVNATWTWNGSAWTRKNPASSPSPRQVYAMAYDTARGEVVLYGGYDSALGSLKDTWVWDGSNWTERFPAVSPPYLAGQRMAFDSTQSEIVLFGGWNGSTYSSDTWTWNGLTWTREAATAPPPGRFYGALTDSADGVLLFGGEDGVNRMGDSWRWDGSGWTQLTAISSPAARAGHAMAYDAARGETLLFGGWDGAVYFGDSWTQSAGVSPVISGPATNSCPGTSVTLSTQPFASYQWSRNGTPITGATAQNLIATQPGDYTVSVTSASCGAQTSPPRTVTLNLPCPCTIPPKFDGLASVVNGQQSVCSLGLNWSPATLNCGTSLSYSVYRSPISGFTPSAANRIAAGLTAIGYSDYWNLSNNSRYYYIVRATDSMNNTDPNTGEKSGAPSGPVSAVNFLETFEGAQSGGGFDNAGWSHAAITGTTDWMWSAAQSQSPVYSWYSPSQPAIADRALTSPALNLLASSRLSFWHTRAFEGSAAACYDGGTLESSSNGGSSWTALPAAAFSLGGYDGTAASGYGNPISGKPAWCGGAIGPMTEVRADLGGFAGQAVKLRWHAGEDASNATTGWYVDSVRVTDVGTALACGCPAPSGLANNTAADVSACVISGIRVSWTPPANWGDTGLGTRNWTVLRDGTPIASGPCAGTLGETTLTCVDTTAAAGISYSYSVRAANGCGAVITTAGASASDLSNAPTSTGDWTLKTPVTVPPTRQGPALAYDSLRGQVVMFGGYSSGTILNDTWVWEGTNWIQKFPAISPPVRFDAAVAYDETRGEIVLFGGLGASFQSLNDTWVWDGMNWTQKLPANSPPARGDLSAAYDGARQEVVIFGGWNGSNLNDTWTWNGTNWAQKSPATSPTQRSLTSLVYDPLRSEILMFGGYFNSSSASNETWVWNGSNWTQKFPANSPTERSAYGSAFDAGQGKALIFGNLNNGNGDQQLWAWDGSNWSQQSTVSAPSSRHSVGMAYDAIRGQVVLFGGGLYGNPTYNDTWVYQGALAVIGPNANTCPDETVDLSVPAFTSYQWNRNGTPIPGATAQNYTVGASGDYSATVTNASGCSATTPDKAVTITVPCPCPRPSGLANNTAADVSACSAGIQVSWTPPANWNDGGLGTRGWTVLRGGVPVAGGPCGGLLAETVLNCIDTTAPAGVALIYSVRASNGCGTTQTTAGMSATDVNNAPSTNLGWSNPAPVLSPPVRERHSLDYDSARGVSVLFGGYGDSNRNDTWTWNGATWTQLFPATAPSARYGHATAYDTTRSELVLFGGYNNSVESSDTWTWNGATWTQKSPPASPSGRHHAAMAFDPVRGESVLFGGCTSIGNSNETWVWNGTDWQQRSPALSPPARCVSTMAYDPLRGEMVLFGGYNGSALGDTWVWNGTTWTQKSPAQSPSARSNMAMAFSAGLSRIVIFGDFNNSSQEAWTWDGTTWTPLTDSPAPATRYSSAITYDTARGQLVLFGGSAAGAGLNDTWLHSSGLSVIGPNANTCPSETVDLSVSTFTSYQWNRNGTPIPGATAQNYTVTTSGNYSATVTNATGCSATTPDKAVTITAPCPCAFAGLASAVSGGQANCAVNLGWAPVTGGCGPGATYNVYRSISTGFTPAPANRIATGLTAITYADAASLTSGTQYYYIARSVSGIGVEDSNTVEKSAAPAGPVTTATFTDTFEGALSGGGFDNAGWTHGPIAGTSDWSWSSAQSQSPTHSWYSASVDSASKGLVSPALQIIASSTLAFHHAYNTESCCDRLYLEVSTDDGGSWSGLPAGAFTAGGYNCGTNWCGGTIGALTQVDASLGAYAGQTIKLRWRETDDSSVMLTGWYVDSVTVTGSTPSSCTSGCAPPTPTITSPVSGCAAGSVQLSTQAYAAYQWYRNGAAIPGATSQSYSATQSGSYTVTADTVAGCAGVAPAYAVTIASCCPPVITNNTAADADTCAVSGVNVGWSLPSDWGDGGGGARSVSVLRNTTTLTSGGCNAPAATQTACTDATGPAGSSYTYALRFTNGCGQSATTSGAAATDANNALVYAWQLQNPAARPPIRYLHSMTYDAARGQVVLFGGYRAAGGTLSDTWMWNGASWTQLFPAATPTARYGAMMAYDSARNQTVLFGGFDGAYQNDTWVWDGVNWSRKFPAANPPPLYYAAMTFDAVRGEMVLFGGYNGSVYRNETWVWNGVNWTRKFPLNSPPPRSAMGMAYDPIRAEIVLFGGAGSTGTLGDTWGWDGANWVQKFPPSGPAPRAYHAAAYEPVLTKVLILGCDSCADAGQTWAWDGTAWSTVAMTSGLSARNSAAMAYDGARSKLALFGGLDTGALEQNDTWNLFLPIVSPVSLAKSGGGTQAAFTWFDIPLATTYTVYQDPAGGGPFTAVTGTALSGNPGLTVPMPAGNSLFFRVAAANSCGEGPK